MRPSTRKAPAVPNAQPRSLTSLRMRGASAEGSIDELALAENRAYAARVFPMQRGIYIRGWALDAKRAKLASEVRLVVDGSYEVLTAYGHTRADIAAVFGSAELSRCGFEATIPPILGPGDHGIEAYAVDADGEECFCVASLTLHVVPTLVPRIFTKRTSGWTLGSIEHLANDDDTRSEQERAGRLELTIGGGCVVNGWALERNTRATLVEVGAVVDAHWYLQGQAGIERADVAKAHGVPSIPGCGFAIRFALNFLDPGVHTLQVVGRLSNCSWVNVGNLTSFEAIAPSLPWIWALTELQQDTTCKLDELQLYTRDEIGRRDSPPDKISVEPGSAIYLSGWAVDRPAMTPAAGVYFSVDRDRRDPIPARYGLPSTDLALKTGLLGWSHCGFTGLLPTKDLEPGVHTVELLIVSRNWNGFYPIHGFQFRIPTDYEEAIVNTDSSVTQRHRKRNAARPIAQVHLKFTCDVKGGEGPIA
jgi:hypothetical protein